MGTLIHFEDTSLWTEKIKKICKSNNINYVEHENLIDEVILSSKSGDIFVFDLDLPLSNKKETVNYLKLKAHEILQKKIEIIVLSSYLDESTASQLIHDCGIIFLTTKRHFSTQLFQKEIDGIRSRIESLSHVISPNQELCSFKIQKLENMGIKIRAELLNNNQDFIDLAFMYVIDSDSLIFEKNKGILRLKNEYLSTVEIKFDFKPECNLVKEFTLLIYHNNHILREFNLNF